MMPITEAIESLREYASDAAKPMRMVLEAAAEHLMLQRKELASLKVELVEAKSEREYFRSRAAFFAEVAGPANSVLSVEGYKAFRGTMRIRPKTAAVPAFELTGDWLYKPDTGCWYGKGSSFAADICTIMEVR